jgi:hypothetical protein
MLWLLFGLGLNTKFIVLPLLAGLVCRGVRLREPKTLLRAALDVLASLAVALLVMAPFGVAAVFRSTVLFNLTLDDRALLTTYYPNVVSALFYLLDARPLYPFAAVGLLGAAVLAGSRLPLGLALLTACFAFLLVIPTPEIQYMPMMVYLTLVVVHAPDAFGSSAPARTEEGSDRPALGSRPRRAVGERRQCGVSGSPGSGATPLATPAIRASSLARALARLPH